MAEVQDTPITRKLHTTLKIQVRAEAAMASVEAAMVSTEAVTVNTEAAMENIGAATVSTGAAMETEAAADSAEATAAVPAATASTGAASEEEAAAAIAEAEAATENTEAVSVEGATIEADLEEEEDIADNPTAVIQREKKFSSMKLTRQESIRCSAKKLQLTMLQQCLTMIL